MRALKVISRAKLLVHYFANPKAYIILIIFEHWLIYCFILTVEKFGRDNGIPFKIILILDNSPGHPPYLDDFNENAKVVYHPSNTTSLL